MSLKKELGFFGVFSIATGAMISSGIFILPGLAFALTGPGVFISYFLAGLLALVGIFSIIELSTAMPKAGGDYYYINRSLGPFLGTISGFLSWFALSLKSAFAIFGMSEIIFIATGFPTMISSVIICLFFVSLNIIGVKEVAKFQISLVASLLILLVLYIIFGVSKVNFSHFTPFLTNGVHSIFATTGFIFISFGGLLKVASISEEIKNPKKNIPLGMIASVVTVTIIYTLLLVITVGILPASEFSTSLTPIADVGKIIAGNPGFIIISIAAFLAFITTANAGIMSASRYPLALSRDNLLPQGISKVSKKFKTPALSIIITGLFIILSLLLPLEMLVKAAIDLGMKAIEITSAFLLISIAFYVFYGRKRFSGEYAFLHLLKRITDNKLSEHLLETELRDIIVDRDNIQHDKFDNLVKTSKIIDLDGPLDKNELFKLISKNIAEAIKMDKKDVLAMLEARQQESNTAISPFVAIPHIIIKGENHFFLMLIRCKEGIKFTNEENSVKAIFVFVGTEEDRTFHLQTLSSIATLIQQEDFEEKWMKAENIHYLRDMLLMCKRLRIFK